MTGTSLLGSGSPLWIRTTTLAAMLLLVCARASPCTPAVDMCMSYLDLTRFLSAEPGGEPISGKDQRKALKRATKYYGKDFLDAYAYCLFRGPEAVDVSQIEDLLMRAKSKEHVIRLLDLNQLRSSSPQDQARLLRLALEEGNVRLWRGYVIERDEAYRLVSILGLTSLRTTMGQVCEVHPPKHVDCAHFEILLGLFPKPGPYAVRASAFLSQLQSYPPKDLARSVHNIPAFDSAVVWGISEVCPRPSYPYTDICNQIRLTICKAADDSYPPHPPVDVYPFNRGPLDNLASQVTPPCNTPCPGRHSESDARPDRTTSTGSLP